MRNLIATMLMLAGVALACTSHSIPTAPATNRVAAPAANDKPSSDPSDGAAEVDATTAGEHEASTTAAVVSSVSQHSPISHNLPAEARPPLTIAEQMLAVSNLYGVVRTESPELTAAAQDHADFLAVAGYGAYMDSYGRIVQQPNAHDGWGNGTPRSRAIAHGFTGSLTTHDPRSSYWGSGVTGEIIYCGKVPIEKAFESWSQHDTGHWIPLTSPTFDVAGFGRAFNASGQAIHVGMFGNSKVAAAAPPVAVSAPARSAPQVFSSCGPGMPCYQPQQQTYQRRGLFGRR